MTTFPNPLRHASAVRVAEDAVKLLGTGRPEMALRVLQPLPALIRDELAAAHADGVEEGCSQADPAVRTEVEGLKM